MSLLYMTPLGGGPVVLTVTSPIFRQILQRNGSNQGTVVVSGSYTGFVTSVRAKAISITGGTTTGWNTIASSEGLFSDSFTANMGWYQLVVQAFQGPNMVANFTVSKFGIGEVFITCGQSLSVNSGQTMATVSDDRICARSLFGPWQLANDPQPNSGSNPGSGGSVWPAFANLMIAYLNSGAGIPLGFLSIGVGSTTSANWLPGGTDYSHITNAVQQFPINGFRCITWDQGESDATNGVTQSVYYNNLVSIIGQSITDAGWAVPWGIGSPETYESGSLPGATTVAAAQAQLISNGIAQFSIDMDNNIPLGDRFDGTHLNTAGMAIMAGLWKTSIVSFFGL